MRNPKQSNGGKSRVRLVEAVDTRMLGSSILIRVGDGDNSIVVPNDAQIEIAKVDTNTLDVSIRDRRCRRGSVRDHLINNGVILTRNGK